MKRLFIAAAAVTLSSSFALAGSSTPLAIGALGGIYRSPTTMPIAGLKNWSFGSLANLPFQILILRQGANTNTITTIDSGNSHVSTTNVVIQNSSILTGF